MRNRSASIALIAPTLGPGVAIDVDRLIATRLLVQANSGGGKSWAIRRILEQTYGACQHVVVDVEGEFHSLREKFDYVLAAPSGGDCRVDVESAPLLARRLLELNVSAIIDVYELGAQRAPFLTRFLNALVNAPRTLWHPTIIVLDEAQKFCKEGSPSESGAAVEALMTLGRKRGFCPILATQRISELRKSAAAECNNKLIGRCGLDVDMARAGKELGFRRREDAASLRDLAPGEFYAFGPAFSAPGVTRVQIGPVETTHPEVGQGAAPPTPPSERIRAILAKIGDLPAEAAEEVRTVESLRDKVSALERALRTLREASSPEAQEIRVVEKVVEKLAIPAAISTGLVVLARHIDDLSSTTTLLASHLARVDEDLRGLRGVSLVAPTLVTSPSLLPEGKVHSPRARHPRAPKAPKVPKAPKAPSPVEGLSASERRLLEALAFLEAIGQATPPNEAVAVLAGYRARGGAWSGMRGTLRAHGLIDYPSPGTMALTELGRDRQGNGGDAALPASGAQLRERVLGRLSGLERKILTWLIEAYPESRTITELAHRNGYEARGGAFSGARGRLRTLGLASYPRPGFMRAADLLFPARSTNDDSPEARSP